MQKNYWSDRTNRRDYIRWLGRRLGFRSYADWYQVTRQHFKENGGGGLLMDIYRDSPYAALSDLMPQHEWKPWLMASTPQGFWRHRQNRVWFMQWLGDQLGFRTDEDWHGLRQKHFHQYGGAGLLANYYHNSPLRALQDYKPHVQWREWQLAKVTPRFWADPDNRYRFMCWLADQLHVQCDEDWYQLTREHLHAYGASTLTQWLPNRHPIDLLREYRPNYVWKPWLFYRVPNGFWQIEANREDYVRWLGHQLGFRRRKADWYQLEPVHLWISGGSGLLMSWYHNCLLSLLQDQFPVWRWDSRSLRHTRNPHLVARLHRQGAVRAYIDHESIEGKGHDAPANDKAMVATEGRAGHARAAIGP